MSLFYTYQHLFHIVGAIFQTIVWGKGKSQSNNGLSVTIETVPYNKQTWNSKLRKKEGRRRREKKMLTLGQGVSSLISLSAPLPFALWNLSFITLSATPVNTSWKDSSIGNCKVLVEVTGGTTRWSQLVAHCRFLGLRPGATLSPALPHRASTRTARREGLHSPPHATPSSQAGHPCCSRECGVLISELLKCCKGKQCRDTY